MATRPASRPAASQPAPGPVSHGAVAAYAQQANKTFFAFVGDSGQGPAAMVSHYDHATRDVARPVAVRAAGESRPCQAVSVVLGQGGTLWLFTGAVGGPTGVFKASSANESRSFEAVTQLPFNSPQPWYVEGSGFVCAHGGPDGRGLWVSTSTDGRDWGRPQLIAEWGRAGEAVSWRQGKTLGLAFTARTEKGGAEGSGNLYYLQTADGGKTWMGASRQPVTLPLKELDNPVLVYNYLATPFGTYPRDLILDRNGNATIVFATRIAASAPTVPGCYLNTARWTGRRWELNNFGSTDDVGDTLRLYIEAKMMWRLVGGTGRARRQAAPGGDIMSWGSDDFGRSWVVSRLATAGAMNCNGVNRPVDAKSDFYVVWHEGDRDNLTNSRLFFADEAGTVYQLPQQVAADTAKPIIVKAASAPATATGPR